MSNTKHTPGPWIIYYDHTDIIRGKVVTDVHVYDNDKDWLCTCTPHAGVLSPIRTMQQVLANAKLIAAAPELLDACIAITETFKNYCGFSGDVQAIEKVRLAIKKATE